ncbi:hypothetical protein A7K93_09975 [Candidatus Methylacidiphilum fumarolicum]|nr:hypothetical protein A7K73_10815 [Candidatus Methylacidiphilum fumarolicum]TFE71903.1 hypothetical protein A7K93_09975 [Candidatus Methylacidiphilum fumarolicum]TFE73030.1 hypothetical protein A7K72_07410 [Candidatus Methylacidiphilum fumarolicum]TFE76254.1 hypothetical protein A7D33_10620 [Candidatus Methylacidiphilum fumarolicum]
MISCFYLSLCLAQEPPESSFSSNALDIDIGFKKRDLTPGEEMLQNNSLDDDKPYVIFDMSLNDFLVAMAQRAKCNYIPKKSVEGRVSAVFYATDPILMAKTASQANGYKLLTKEKIFEVKRKESGMKNSLPSLYTQDTQKKNRRVNDLKSVENNGVFKAKLHATAHGLSHGIKSNRPKGPLVAATSKQVHKKLKVLKIKMNSKEQRRKS